MAGGDPCRSRRELAERQVRKAVARFVIDCMSRSAARSNHAGIAGYRTQVVVQSYLSHIADGNCATPIVNSTHVY